MKKRIITLGILILAAAVIVVGCSRTKTIKTDEGEITFTEKGDKLEIKTSEGSLTIGKNEIPDGFPKDVPIYKPSTIAISQVMDDKNFMLNLTTPDEMGTVTKFYENKLKKNGWTIGNRMNLGPASIMSSTKGNKELNITINRDEKITIIALIVSEEG